MNKLVKRLLTGTLAFATILTALPVTAVHASGNQYWTESAERVGYIEHVMNDIPENGSFTAKYNKDQTEYTIYNASEKEVCNFVVDYQKERPVQEYIYPNHVSYIEVSPKFTKD